MYTFRKKIIVWTGFIACSFVLPPLLCSTVSSEESRRLTSLGKGFFYASKSKGEGVVQFSDCKELEIGSGASPEKNYACVRDNNGFRCTTPGSLDVIFVFDDMKECIADRERSLNSDEE